MDSQKAAYRRIKASFRRFLVVGNYPFYDGALHSDSIELGTIDALSVVARKRSGGV